MKSKAAFTSSLRLARLAPAARSPAARSPAPVTRTADLHLRLMATSDLHVQILPFDYYARAATDRFGFARTATLISQARAEVANSLLFDNGDFLQGSPLADYIARSRGLPYGNLHPMIAAMNHLRYDAGTLGNHEFNFGLDFLAHALNGANFPILSANVQLCDDDTETAPLGPAFVILDRTVIDTTGASQTLKVGVIGFTPPQILIWDQQHLAGRVTVQDIVDAAKMHVPEMRRQGADLIVALSHSGIGPVQPERHMENASTALAAVDGIDVVIAGHSHLVFPSGDFHTADQVDPVLGTLCGKPAVMPGFYGSHLGVIDLVLSPENGRYKIQRHTSEARPIWQRSASGTGTALVASDPDIINLTAKVHSETLDWTARPIGHSAQPLNSFFALIAETPALQLVAAAQTQHVEKMLAESGLADLPVLASVAPFKAGGRGGPENYTDVPAGEIMLSHASDLYIHPNSSFAIRLTGAEIEAWLEYAVGIFNQIPPGSIDFPLINPDFPSFNFDMIYGLAFQIDLAAKPRFDVRGMLANPDSHRILNLTLNDLPLDPVASYIIATNSYRVAAIGQHLRQDPARVVYQSTESHLNLILRYFAESQPAPVPKLQSRRFASMPGTTVTFDTSPKAIDHLADIPDLQLDSLGITSTGFLRFRLHL